MTRVYLALGSNLGDRLANLRAAVAALEERGIAVAARSSVWETPPVPAGQPPFLNAAVAAETTLDPPSLLRELKAIERALGRRPGPHWGPRPIDIDILFHGDARIETPELAVPHPRIAERAFVLAPLSDITSGALPIFGRSAIDLLGRTGLQGAVRRLAL
jgi:2-amino-4-hydroxy-6-hydroxymethyldihydropteridine diphosphokinase